MKVKYTKAYLNVVESNADVQLELLTIKDELFLDATIVSHDSFNVEINYKIENYRPISKLKYSYEIETKRVVLKVIELIEKVSDFYNIDISPDNLFFDSSLNVKMLKRSLKADFTHQNFIEEIKSLYVYMMTDYDYEDILKSGNLMVKKYDTNLSELNDMQDIKLYLEQLCVDEIDEFFKSETIVKTKSLKRIKTIRNSTIALAVISIILVSYVMFFKVATYKVELKAEENFANEKYGDVIDDLGSTSFSKMNLHTKYIMAQSAIRTAPLQEFQKENLLPNITMQSSGDLLEYWVSFGQKNYTKSRDIAKIMGDIELQVFSILALLDETKNDTSLEDVEKTELIAKYQEEIDTLLSELEKSKNEE